MGEGLSLIRVFNKQHPLSSQTEWPLCRPQIKENEECPDTAMLFSAPHCELGFFSAIFKEN